MSFGALSDSQTANLLERGSDAMRQLRQEKALLIEENEHFRLFFCERIRFLTAQKCTCVVGNEAGDRATCDRCWDLECFEKALTPPPIGPRMVKREVLEDLYQWGIQKNNGCFPLPHSPYKGNEVFNAAHAELYRTKKEL